MSEGIIETITVKEAGRRLGISRYMAYQMAGQDRIPVLKFGNGSSRGQRWRVPLVAFSRMLSEPA